MTRKGFVPSEEHRKKISQALRGHPVSWLTRDHISRSKMGQTLSDEIKERISQSQKARLHQLRLEREGQ